jgi:hypothetical protein
MKNCIYALPIYDTSTEQVNPTFIRANSALILKHMHQMDNSLENFEILKNLWLTEYNATIDSKEGVWLFANFKNQKDLTLFSLKWS